MVAAHDKVTLWDVQVAGGVGKQIVAASMAMGGDGTIVKRIDVFPEAGACVSTNTLRCGTYCTVCQ